MAIHPRSVSHLFRLLALAAPLALVACSKPEVAPEPVRAVKVMTVGASPMLAGHEYAGEVRARVESRLGFRVGGKIVRRQAEVGQRVRAGDVLAQLDPQDYQLAADAARAQVAAAATNRDLAAADYKRYAALKEQNFISGAELERRDTALKAAQAQLEQAQAQLAGQANQTRYTHLIADVAGVVTGVDAEVGQVVSAGSPVVRIAQDGPRDVLFSVPEDKVVAIRPGSPVTVRIWASQALLQGKVREVASSADPATRTYAVKVGLDGLEAAPLGATAYVSPAALSAAGLQVIKLPTSALRQEGGGTAVWVLDMGTMTVRAQKIRIATADGNEAVVAEGLQPGMTIVATGVHVLTPGQKVSIFGGAAPPPAAAPAPAAPPVSAAASNPR